ncbi:MAG: hypothetical protein PVG45_05585, partial [Gammaproteobacteria bacterium]
MRKYTQETITSGAVLFVWLIFFSIRAHTEYGSPEVVEGSITTSVEEAKILYDKEVVFIDVHNPRLYA